MQEPDKPEQNFLGEPCNFVGGRERSNRSCKFNLYEFDPRVMIERIEENHPWVSTYHCLCIFSYMHTKKHTLAIELATHYIDRPCHIDCMKRL